MVPLGPYSPNRYLFGHKIVKKVPIYLSFGVGCIKILMPTQRQNALVATTPTLLRSVNFLSIAWVCHRKQINRTGPGVVAGICVFFLLLTHEIN